MKRVDVPALMLRHHFSSFFNSYACFLFIGAFLGFSILGGCGSGEKKPGVTVYPQTIATPPGGDYSAANYPVVTLECNNPATIYYTLDGENPYPGMSNTFSGRSPVTGIEVKTTATLKFFALDDKGNQEAIRSEVYTVGQTADSDDTTPPKTSAVPAGGRYQATQNITISANEPATIYYKIYVNEYDPARCPDPDVSSPDVKTGDTTVSGIQVQVGVLKYFSVDRAGNAETVNTQVYLYGNSPYTYIFPSGGFYKSSQILQVYSDVIQGATATIYYTTDGAIPDPSSPSCISPCNILIYNEGTTVLKYFAVDNFGNTESVRIETYIIDSITPVTTASLAAGEYMGAQSITLTASEPTTIYYTLDGSDPVPGSQNTFSGPSPISNIAIDRDITVKFFSVDSAGNAESPVNSVAYSIVYSFTDTFRDDSKKNAIITTADWDTVNGEVKLARGSIQIEKSISTGGISNGFDIFNQQIFLADGLNGLKIYDISSPGNPELRGNYPAASGEIFSSVIVRNNTAFAGTNMGVLILDVSNPSSPGFISRWNPGVLNVFDIRFFGKYLFVAAGNGGLWVADVADTANPVDVTNLLFTGKAVSLEVFGSTLYVAATDGDLKIIDITQPASPVLVRTQSMPDSINSLAVAGSRLFAGSNNGVIYEENLQYPQKPVFTASIKISSSAVNHILYSGKFLYAATGTGIFVIDPADSTNMKLLAASLYVSVNWIAVYENYMFASGSNFLSLPISKYRTPQDIGALTGFAALESKVNGNILVVPSGVSGVKIIELNNVENPVLYTGYQTTGSANRVDTAGNYGFVAYGASGLMILNMSDLSNVQNVSSVPSLDLSLDVVVDANYAYLADRAGGLRIVDISNPSAPSVAGSCVPGACLPAASRAVIAGVAGKMALAGLDTNKVAIIDVTNRTNPSLIATFNTAGLPVDMEISGNYVYIAEGASGIEVFYIGNPQSPLKAGSLSTPNNSATGISISGNTLFIADGSYILFADITNPSSPFISNYYSKNSFDLARWGEYLMISDGTTSVEIVDLALESIRYQSPGTAASVNINPQSRNIGSAKILVNDYKGAYGDIQYYLSNTGGTAWIAVTPGEPFIAFETAGKDLWWRAVLSTTDLRKTPILDRMEVFYKYAD